ncbi:MAG: hypothetical protein ACTS3R_09850, partial [Inquilinaceae bacterium]
RHPKSPANAIFIFVILLSVMSVGPLGMAPAQETLHWMIAALIAGNGMQVTAKHLKAARPTWAASWHGPLPAPRPASSLQEQLYLRRWTLLGGPQENAKDAADRPRPNTSGRRWGLLGPQTLDQT